MKKTILLTLLLLAVGGCAKWQNPNLVDQSQRDQILNRDKAYCSKITEAEVPIGAGTDGEAIEPSTYEAEFSENYTSAKTFESCMKDRGWVKD